METAAAAAGYDVGGANRRPERGIAGERYAAVGGEPPPGFL